MKPFPVPFGAVDPSRRIVVVAPSHASVARGIIAATRVPDGRVVLPDSWEVVDALRANGGQIPSPMLRYYGWCGGAPYSVQRTSCDMLVHSRRAYVFSGMGVGKTKTALWAFDYLREVGAARRALVVSPLSTINNVWLREVMSTAPHLRAVPLRGTPKQVASLVETPHDIAVINPDGVTSRRDILLAARYDVIIIDEASAYRNATSARFKAMFAVAKEAQFVWAMTGTPTPRAPTDAHGLLKLLYPNHPLARSVVRFRDYTMNKVSTFTWLPKADAHERLRAVLQPSVRFTLKDVAELPETVYLRREVEMSPQQRDLYEQLRKRMLACAGEITAANAGVLLNKLLQVATGAVYKNDRSVLMLDTPARLEALADVVRETEHNLLVFVPFVPLAEQARHAVEDAAKREGHSLLADVVTGQTPLADRNAIFAAFQQPVGQTRRAIVAHPRVMAHGLTLTEADTVVWYGPIDDLELYDQANHRIIRPGQKHKTRIVGLVGSPVERRAYNRLSTKETTQNMLLEVLETPA